MIRAPWPGVGQPSRPASWAENRREDEPADLGQAITSGHQAALAVWKRLTSGQELTSMHRWQPALILTSPIR